MLGSAAVARRIVAAVERSWPGSPADNDHHHGTVVGSVDDLARLDLSGYDVVLCCRDLPDGTLPKALELLESSRPGLPVILVGGPGADEGSEPRGLGLLVELASAAHRVQSLVERLEALARTDELTCLGNRRWLNEMLARLWEGAAGGAGPLACLMIDLDRFKTVNDRLGHLGGDRVLRETARFLRENCRRVDVIARYGGDEFCVLMPGCPPSDAPAVAERLLEAWRLPHAAAAPGGPAVLPGISIGVAHVDLSRPSSAEDLLHHADEALYAAKAAGGGCVMVRAAAACAAAPDAAHALRQAG